MESFASYKQTREALENGSTTCKQVVEYYLNNIHRHNDLNVFLDVYENESLDQADLIDKKLRKGTARRLAGMVIGIKDVLCHIDHPLQAGSNILEGFQSQFSGTAIQRLIDEDAIIIGRQNCDEFAMGSSNENSAFGPVLNAADKSRVPGGSSGGSAVSVQANMCHVALGTDTGGSVRQPAAFCGVIGLKPTYSRISRHGLAAYASSFDVIGIFSSTIDDNALVLEIIAGKDNFDSTVSSEQVDNYSDLLKFSGSVKIAYIKETLEREGLSQEIKEKTVATLDALKSDGHSVECVEFPMLDYLLPIYYILTMAEASSNLSRYDGVKYGHRSESISDLESLYKKSRSEGFGEEVKRRIMLGTFILSASYYDAYYTKALKARRLVKEKTEELLSQYDFIVLPTTPTPAFKLGERSKNPIEMYLADLFTVQASVSGIPAISIPNGCDSEGLPIGLQVMTKSFDEAKLLAFSKYLLENK